MFVHTLKFGAPGACVQLQLLLRVCAEKETLWWLERQISVKGGFLVARTACWWIFWQMVHPASPLLAPQSCLLLRLYLLHRCRRLQGWQGQVCKGRQLRGGEGKRKGEIEAWKGPGGQLERLRFSFPNSHLHRQNGFFLSIWLFILPRSPSIYTPRLNSFSILFCFLHASSYCHCSHFSK